MADSTAPAWVAPENRGSGLRILIIDNVSRLATMYRDMYLTRWPEARIEMAYFAEQAEEKIAQFDPYIVHLDLELVPTQPSTGLDLLAKIRKRFRHSRIVVVSHLAETHYIEQVLAIGAKGYWNLNELNGHADFIRGIEAVLCSGETFSPRVKQRVEELREKGLAPRAVYGGDIYDLDKLSPREKEIFDQIRRRRTNKEIADMLHIKERTVVHHISSILHKLSIQGVPKHAREQLENWEL